MIRAALPADVPAMLAVYAPYVTETAVTFEYEPPSERAFAERFRIPIRFFENEGHSLGGHPETPDRVADLALAFFTCDLPENDLRTETGIRPNEPKAE